MKKLFILAAAAVVALAACTKTEVETSAPDQAITFQVANYSSATKAPTSLVTEGFQSFKTYAWYTSSTDTDQPFMTPATVEYEDPKWHATDRTYFWPKTGYVNFYSFAGNYLPKTVTIDADRKVKANYSDELTIGISDNILIADAAFGYNSNPSATYGLDNVTAGVPTLFRHMLSKVYFDIRVDATEVTDTKNKWEVTVTNATVSYSNKGTMVANFSAAPSVTLGTDNKPVSGSTSTAKYHDATWTPGATDATLSKTSDDVKPFANGNSLGDAVKLIDESVVMPQVLGTTNVTIALTYTIKHTYDGGTPVTETVPIAATALTSFSSAISEWVPNTIYKYHIIIKPNGEILFDPAVEEWTTNNNAGTYTIL